jgi:hypothetical protein
LAEETGTSGAAGSEFPVFKSSEGAFDRAKYEEQDKARIVSDGITARSTGKEIDEDLVKKKKSADQVIKEANKFYDDSFQKNVKGLDPAYDPSLIYYSEAYSDGGLNKNKIRRKLEKGETIDGKEIFEMSKQSAENKISNAKVLKDGRVTDIVENLGLKDVKQFGLFEDVKSDFDSKIKDEKIKFEPLLDNFAKLLHYFSVKDSFMASQYAPILYTPENMAIISALGKVLEAEGFTNESVTKTAKAYDDNIKKLIEKKEGKKAEDVIKEAAQEAKKGETTTKTEEQKLEEKKAEDLKKEPIAENKDIKLDQPKEATTTTTTTTTTIPTAEEPKKTEEKKEPEVKTAEQKLDEKKPEEKKEATGTVEGKKDEGEKGKGKEKEPVFSEPVKGIFDMLGINLPAAKEGEGDKGEGDEDKGKNKGLTTGSAQGDKTIEELGFAKPKEGESGGDKGKKDNKSTTDNKATKLDEKVSTNTDKKSETSTASTPIKETQTQNLSSVSTPDTDKKDVKKEEPATTTATTTENQTVDKNAGVSNDVKTTSEAPKETEDKTKKEDQDKMNKEMSDNMKSMVALLAQLNNTLKNPLMVIPNNKKFH